MNQNNKNILLLGLVSFINDTASKIIIPILPLFIVSKEIGGTGLAVGIIAGLGDSIASLFEVVSGFLSDRLGRRKPFVFLGYLTASLSKFLFSIAKTWHHILILKSAERLGKGLRSAPRDAIIAASTEKKTRGRGFGIHRAMDSGGAAFGSILTLIMSWALGFTFRDIFLIAGIISFLSLTPIFFVKDKKTPPNTTSLHVGIKSLPLSLKLFMIVATLFALGNFSEMFFILRSLTSVKWKLVGAGGIPIIPIIAYIIYSAAYSLFSVPAGMLSDKIGRRTVLFMGYSLFSLICLGFIFSQTLVFFIILFVLFGLNYALVEATERAFVSDIVPESIRGTALGTFNMFTSLVALPGGFIAGSLWDLNVTYTFIYGAVVSVTAIILFSILKSKIK